MKRTIFIALALLAGCTARIGEPECSRTAAHGVYRIEYVRQSGDCQEIPAQLVDIADAAGTVGAECTTAAPEWSQSDCHVETVSHCGQATITQALSQSADARTLDGTLSVRSPQCTATYAVHGAKQ